MRRFVGSTTGIRIKMTLLTLEFVVTLKTCPSQAVLTLLALIAKNEA
jgi:hypothetical protein